MSELDKLQGKYSSYKIEDGMPFARGRISILYKAVNDDGDTVCVKLFDEPPVTKENDKARATYWAELDAQMKLLHPNVLPVLDYYEGENPFIVYPLCDKGTLREIIDARAFVPLDEALPLLKQIAQAIDFAHSSGIIHGDIKPENVLFKGDRSTPLLSDFGMSKHFPHVERIRTIIEQPVAGTSAYLSPEQISESKQSSLSDIYAFGVVSFELLTGKLPVDVQAPPFRQMKMKVEGDLIDPRDANPALSEQCSEAVKAALSLERKQRPQTAGEFYKYLSGQSLPPKQSTGGGWFSSLDTKSRVSVITAIVAAVAGIVTALIKILPEFLK